MHLPDGEVICDMLRYERICSLQSRKPIAHSSKLKAQREGLGRKANGGWEARRLGCWDARKLSC